MKNRIILGIAVLSIFMVTVFLIKPKIEKEVCLLYNEKELAKLLEEDYPSHVMIDLREKKDYEEGHIKGFINIPSKDGAEVLEYLNKNNLQNKYIYIMCYSGNRAAAAISLLQDKNYQHLIYITFGYDEFANSQDGFVPEVGECDCLAK